MSLSVCSVHRKLTHGISAGDNCKDDNNAMRFSQPNTIQCYEWSTATCDDSHGSSSSRGRRSNNNNSKNISSHMRYGIPEYIPNCGLPLALCAIMAPVTGATPDEDAHDTRTPLT